MDNVNGIITLLQYKEYVAECGIGFFWFNTVQLVLFGICMIYTILKNRRLLSIGNILLVAGSCGLFLGREYVFIHY